MTCRLTDRDGRLVSLRMTPAEARVLAGGLVRAADAAEAEVEHTAGVTLDELAAHLGVGRNKLAGLLQQAPPREIGQALAEIAATKTSRRPAPTT